MFSKTVSSAVPGTNPVLLQVKKKPFGPAEVLLFYDGPQLMYLLTESARYLAMALPDDAGKWPFLLTKLDPETAAQLEAREITLRSVYVRATELLLVPDYDEGGEFTVQAYKIGEIPEDWLPGDVPI